MQPHSNPAQIMLPPQEAGPAPPVSPPPTMCSPTPRPSRMTVGPVPLHSPRMPFCLRIDCAVAIMLRDVPPMLSPCILVRTTSRG